MQILPGRTAIAAVLITALPLGTPAMAAALPRADSVAALPAGLDTIAEHSRRYRDRDDGIEAGDVIAGVAVLGAIAAIAGVFDGDRNEPRQVPVDTRRREDDARASGLDRAVNMCVAEIERSGVRVAEVEEATRDAEGWRVAGVNEDGRRFDCRIGNDGRIRGIDAGSRYDASLSPVPGSDQYADTVYARARAGQNVPSGPDYVGGQVYSAPEAPVGDAYDDPYGDEPRPAYPGGPLPGEEGYDAYGTGLDQAGYYQD